MQRWIGITFWSAAIISTAWISFETLPPQHNPLAPLDISDPIGVATSTKLKNMIGKPDVCKAYLERSDIAFTGLENSVPDQPCGFYDALTLNRSALPYAATLQMTCPLTAALVTWEKESLFVQAETHLQSEPVKVRAVGSYACRRRYGRQTGKYSEHATGNAIDIGGFELADGRVISVEDDWGKDSDEGRFLRAIHDDACRIYGTVLSPDYNEAHANHFHLDMSQTGICK